MLILATSFRVVPVGHALVIFNTVSKSFRLGRQGITFVPPFISVTQDYDLRRLEYTMSGVSGEGRKANIDDSLWSPTQEGLQVGIDLTLWHHLDPARLISIHQRIGPDYEEKVIRAAVRSVIRLVISEYPVMDVYSSKRALIQDEINRKTKALVEKDGFIVNELVLRDVRFTPEFAKAIEAKQIAQQSAEQNVRYTLEKEQKEAERKVIEAQGRANAIQIINKALAQKSQLHQVPLRRQALAQDLGDRLGPEHDHGPEGDPRRARQIAHPGTATMPLGSAEAAPSARQVPTYQACPASPWGPRLVRRSSPCGQPRPRPSGPVRRPSP